MRRIADKLMNAEDARIHAERRLPRALFLQTEGGTGAGTTLAANTEAFSQVSFAPRAAVHYSPRDLETTVLGHPISLPVLTAPTANVRVFHPDGEPGVARATGAAGTIACISSFTGFPIEEVTAAASGPVFFQLYFLGGRKNAEKMIERAKNAGVKALILTVDTAALAQRERNIRLRVAQPVTTSLRSMIRFAPQGLMHPGWLAGFLKNRMRIETPMSLRPDGKPMHIWEATVSITEESPTWDDIPWIRELWGGPIILKGIVRAEDARRAVDVGASAIVVSNHGGNALDGAPPTIRALPTIAEAVGGEIEILLDSGVRRGADVVKALALGARAVLIGRAYVWAHAAAGSEGVAHMLRIFRTQIDQTLGLLGCPSVEALDPSYVTLPPGFRWPPSTAELDVLA